MHNLVLPTFYSLACNFC